MKTEQSDGAGSLIVVTAPSGAGKTSLVHALLEQQPQLRLSVSWTTRAPRNGEIDGRDYHFVDRPEFERRRQAGEFLEWAEVHGNLYGTSRIWIEQQMRAGVDIVLEIDWQGAVQVQRLFPHAVCVFIMPPSLEALRQRLEARGQDSTAVIAQRMAASHDELREAFRFEYVIINQDFAVALEQLRILTEAARLRLPGQRIRHREVFAALGMDDVHDGSSGNGTHDITDRVADCPSGDPSSRPERGIIHP